MSYRIKIPIVEFEVDLSEFEESQLKKLSTDQRKLMVEAYLRQRLERLPFTWEEIK